MDLQPQCWRSGDRRIPGLTGHPVSPTLQVPDPWELDYKARQIEYDSWRQSAVHRSEPQRSQWETLKHSVFIQSPLLKAQIKCGRGGEEKDCRSQRWWWMSPSKQYLPDTKALIAAWTYKDCSGMHRLEPGKISALRSESGHAYGCRACIISLLSIFFLDFWLFLFVDLFDLRRRERFSFFSFCWVFCLFVFLESMDMKFSG